MKKLNIIDRKIQVKPLCDFQGILFLEKRNSSWDFETVASSRSSNSTDELIDYNSSEDGIYRLRITNYSKTNNIKNLVKDKIALSYLIRGNNE